MIDVTDLLKEWVYDASHGQRLKDTPVKQIPETVRRFTQDIYMCVYINPDLEMYGDGSSSDIVRILLVLVHTLPIGFLRLAFTPVQV